MKTSTPVIFTDGTAFFDELGKQYIQHPKGLFILAPSGVGKTFFVSHQTEKQWIDGDDLYPKANADFTNDEWVSDRKLVEEINIKSDVITMEACKLGFWIIGSSNSFLKPDAIVIPEWNEHVKFVKNRQQNNYDGGATEADLDALIRHRKVIEQWEQKGVPRFLSINDAVTNLIG